MIKQTGLLIKDNPRDFRTGSSPLQVDIINLSADWKTWKPSEEKQYKDYTFDTLACTSFSALNVLETTLNFHLEKGNINFIALNWFKQNGYIVNGKFNMSDRFTAIMSGTTREGNYMQSVWNSIRNDGVIPESDLPFGGNNWDEYHNPSVITDSMKLKAKQFLNFIESTYEWTPVEEIHLIEALKRCPVQIAINYNTHAVELIDIKNIFDTYPPFLYPLPNQIGYALKAFIKIKPTEYKFYNDMELRMSGYEIKKLQERLILEGVYNYAVTGYFGPITKQAVMDYQKKHNISQVGRVGPITRASLNGPMSLVEAIAMVESRNTLGLVGDRTLMNKAYGPLQIRQPCIDDVNKYLQTDYQAEDCLYDLELSKRVFEIYQRIYNINGTDEEKARTWNGGPGWKRNPSLTDGYWNKVKSYL